MAAGALEALLPQWQPPVLTVYALYASRRHLPAAVRALLDFLAERFAVARW
ncbi:LysR substrate-binding domain-containing protein [Paracidovorax cattleyae]|uniref:LysR substrate-binding domain-containing protein n=1 Tax=Paracidovorax cattleyae TaxID=80868 RepID=UPI00336AA212